MSEFHWTPKQLEAIEQLEVAFVAARRAGLAVCGMDSDLLVYKARELDEADEAARMRGSHTPLYDAQQEVCNVRDHAIHLSTHSVYRDSGGW